MSADRTAAGQAVFAVLMAVCVLCLLWARSRWRVEAEPHIFGPGAAAGRAPRPQLFGLGARSSAWAWSLPVTADVAADGGLTLMVAQPAARGRRRSFGRRSRG